MFYQDISGDDATVALMAKHILSGEHLPVFFYRESYMGSLNGFHMVPALFVFGPSVLLVRLNAIAWSLLFPLGLYVLARRLYDETVARVTLLLAAVPPFLLTYFSTVAEPHFETNTFGVILLLLALAVLAAPTEPHRTRVLACLGFIGGLASTRGSRPGTRRFSGWGCPTTATPGGRWRACGRRRSGRGRGGRSSRSRAGRPSWWRAARRERGAGGGALALPGRGRDHLPLRARSV